MHEALHIAVLASTILGAGGLALLVLWGFLFDSPIPALARGLGMGAVGLAGVLFLLEWQVVH